MAIAAAWAPQWVRLAPGISCLLARPDIFTKGRIAADTAAILGGTYSKPRSIAELARPTAGRPIDPVAKVTAQAVIISACLLARVALRDWSGVTHLETGKPACFNDPDAVKAALLEGAAPGRDPLLTAFVGWSEHPREDLRDDLIALRTIGSGGESKLVSAAAARSRAIVADDETLWVHDARGELEGLDYRNALLSFEDRSANDVDGPDFGAAFRCLTALEAGRMELPNG